MLKNHSKPLLLLMVIPALTGCTKRTVVEEISPGESGVVVSESGDALREMDWPQWRGPQSNGVASDRQLPTAWSESQNIQWDVAVPGRGHSSPIVVGDLVVVGTAVESSSEQMVVAYDRDSGEQRWSTVVHKGGFPGRREVHQKATNANSTLASNGELLVTSHLNDEQIFVTALNLQGQIEWQKSVGAFASKFGYAPSPVLYKSLVIVAADNYGEGYLVGLDLQSGEIAWRRARGNASSYSSPAVFQVGGKDQLLMTGGNRMVSYDPATGEQFWQVDCISEATCGTVVATSEYVFASGGYPESETVCISAAGEPVWSERTKLYEPSLITDGENVYGVTDSGIAMCWSCEDGDVLWKKRLGGKFSSSPVLCNGNVYVANLEGNTYVFEATGEDFRQVSVNRLGSDCYASPAIDADSIYLRVGSGAGTQRTERLIRIGTTAPATS